MSSSSVMTLLDGRRLGFSEYGPLDGKSILLFHGAPGSRLESPLNQATLESLNVRLIVPDRPGYGLSDVAAGRTFLSWADDIRQLMDSLTVESCAVAGFSGGGPYAMACAYMMPERILKLGLISSLAPFNLPGVLEGMSAQNRALFDLALADPESFENQIKALVTGGDTLYQIMTASLPEEDQAVFAEENMRSFYQADMTESVRQGIPGIVSDMLLYPRAWGFKPSNVQCKAFLWQGMKDINTPPEMGRALSEMIPDCRANFISEAGHFLLFLHGEKIFAELIA